MLSERGGEGIQSLTESGSLNGSVEKPKERKRITTLFVKNAFVNYTILWISYFVIYFISAQSRTNLLLEAFSLILLLSGEMNIEVDYKCRSDRSETATASFARLRIIPSVWYSCKSQEARLSVTFVSREYSARVIQTFASRNFGIISFLSLPLGSSFS